MAPEMFTPEQKAVLAQISLYCGDKAVEKTVSLASETSQIPQEFWETCATGLIFLLSMWEARLEPNTHDTLARSVEKLFGPPDTAAVSSAILDKKITDTHRRFDLR